jgi:hypothetical protein
MKKEHVLELFLDLNLLQEKSRKENKNIKGGVVEVGKRYQGLNRKNKRKRKSSDEVKEELVSC